MGPTSNILQQKILPYRTTPTLWLGSCKYMVKRVSNLMKRRLESCQGVLEGIQKFPLIPKALNARQVSLNETFGLSLASSTNNSCRPSLEELTALPARGQSTYSQFVEFLIHLSKNILRTII